ncbi:helix-turn-helix domain-containing protein [Rhodobaculum claviforme]|uniref:HTH cro/C1-type domain-containing protein n=1 Tax=Rhodobaculum claviforme TaxID=1549854 RepID=A0A934WHM4_9RHOB|nr:helix-turn-helix transcriptional regulator [Rhodobaculum claviforme]MBK5927330.1 hypothetical protein [Rhodobaculum claviforme]
MRIRTRRLALGLSQQMLATQLGVTFQQIQKYERAINRVSASMLWNMAQALSVPISYFYDALPQGDGEQASDRELQDFQASALMRAFAAIDPPKRAKLLSLARSMVKPPA